MNPILLRLEMNSLSPPEITVTALTILITHTTTTPRYVQKKKKTNEQTKHLRHPVCLVATESSHRCTEGTEGWSGCGNRTVFRVVTKSETTQTLP